MHGVILVLWRVGATLWNGCEIQGQNYVAMFHRSEVKARFPYENLRLIT